MTKEDKDNSDHKYPVRGESVPVDEHLVPLFVGPVEGHEEEVQVDGEAVQDGDLVLVRGAHQLGGDGLAGLVAGGGGQPTGEVHEHAPEQEKEEDFVLTHLQHP